LNKNIENQLRQKAIAVAERQMNHLKGQAFNTIVAGDTFASVSTASGSTFKNISVQTRVADLSASNSMTKQISIRVWWNYHGKTYEHQTASGIGSAELSSGN
jgi:hypothetical protein